MDISESLKDPLNSAVFAGCVTAGYIHIKARMNNEGKLKTSQYVKPSLLVAMLVYFIVQSGVASKETISSEPY